MTSDILVVGGGFAGMWAALAAAREGAGAPGPGLGITLVSRDAYLTMRPRLYECDPAAMRLPLSDVLDPVGVTLIEAEVEGIDPASRVVAATGADGRPLRLEYGRLVLAAGSVLRPPDLPGIAEHGWSIDTYADAVAFDDRLKEVLAPPCPPGGHTFAVIGGGFTGIELATEFRTRIAAHSDKETAAKARIVVIERAEAVGPELGANPRPVIEDALRAAGVELRLGASVAEIGPGFLALDGGERIEAAAVVVTSGLCASPLAGLLPVAGDDLGRLPVDDMLRVEGVSRVFAAGDIARAYADDEHLALMSCQHAITMGKFAGANAGRDALGLPLEPYRQPNYVTCLDLGPSGAVLTSGWDRQIELTGADAKARKQMINTSRIYPPLGDREAILAAATVAPRPG